MGFLEGKTAVITGGSRGLGLEIARAYVREGAAVVLGSRSAESVAKAVESLRAAGGRAEGQACDVGNLESVAALGALAEKAFGGFDIWVNNAAQAGPYGPAVEIDPTTFQAIIQTNILGTYHGAMVALRHFLPKHKGKLINILGRGDKNPTPYQIPYASSKAWVYSFTQALAGEHKGSGVEIMGFNPGMMETELLLRAEVIAGHEAKLASFGSIVRILGVAPEVSARKALWMAGPATDGRNGLLVRGSTFSFVMRFAREGLRRLMGRPTPPADVKIIPIPSAWERPL